MSANHGLIAAVAIAAALATSAQGANVCQSLTDDAKRLACYDYQSKQSVPAVKAVKADKNAVPEEVAARRAFRRLLERTFLSHGVSMDVFADGPRETTLTLWGFLSKATVFQIASDGAVVKQAKELGFRKIDFNDRGDEGHWIFDLSGPSIPQCDIEHRVCL